VRKLRDVFATFDKDEGQHRISKKLETDGGEYYGCSVDKLPVQQKRSNVRLALPYKAWADRGQVTTAYCKEL